MLAIDRLSCAFSSQSTWPLAGLKMMAAAARTSGTRSPFASVLYRGVIDFCGQRIREISPVRAAARARARRALRAWDVDAEYAGVRATLGAGRLTLARGVGFLR